MNSIHSGGKSVDKNKEINSTDLKRKKVLPERIIGSLREGVPDGVRGERARVLINLIVLQSDVNSFRHGYAVSPPSRRGLFVGCVILKNSYRLCAF